MPTILITGAGRGIGFEFARQYSEAGWTVIATVRSPDSIPMVESLGGGVQVALLNVADPASVAILCERMRGTALDMLINNAGLYGPRSPQIGAVPYAAWQEVLDTNVMGAMRVTEAFLPHLRAGERKTIVAMTSKMGSMADNTSGGQYIYRSSKAALNAVFRSLALDLAPEGFLVSILHPGWVRTDMGGPRALIDVHESVTGLRRVIEGLTPDESGRWFDYAGREIPW
ncbi:MAG: SDR family NAD(P)-dependent oxidoreductase [Alphaproteobacteria bacterium]|jgi:NAD(P)-dependent dehydrogenase (short-subunit alcohol dehydrogenase family)|nr:SDR family NAD(P)-dependent oxidoreductase [Alphaproteobacteria bacterium]